MEQACSRLLRYQVEFATPVVRQTGIGDSRKGSTEQCNGEDNNAEDEAAEAAISDEAFS